MQLKQLEKTATQFAVCRNDIWFAWHFRWQGFPGHSIAAPHSFPRMSRAHSTTCHDIFILHATLDPTRSLVCMCTFTPMHAPCLYNSFIPLISMAHWSVAMHCAAITALAGDDCVPSPASHRGCSSTEGAKWKEAWDYGRALGFASASNSVSSSLACAMTLWSSRLWLPILGDLALSPLEMRIAWLDIVRRAYSTQFLYL